jgi:hypothetical protein
VTKAFKDYRQLAMNLSNQGVNVGTIEESQSVMSGITDRTRLSTLPTPLTLTTSTSEPYWKTTSQLDEGNVGQNRKSSMPTPLTSQWAGGGAGGQNGLPPFPRTFKRSSFGIKLPEKDLQERCDSLDRWITGVCQMYFQFSGESQVRLIVS